MNRAISLILVCLSTVSCGQDRETSTEGQYRFEDSTSIEDILSNMPVCNDTEGYYGCETVHKTLDDTDFDWVGFQTVLIVDRLETSSALAFRHRIKRRLSADSFGFYQPSTVEYSLPRAVDYIFEELIYIDGYESLSNNNSMLDKFHQKFPNIWRDKPVEHGKAIMDIIGEYSPSASFVAASSLQPSSTIYCSKDWDRLTEYYRNAANSLKEVVVAEGIHYINLSSGETVDTVRKRWDLICEGELPASEAIKAVEAYATFVEILSNIDQAILFQAAVSSKVPISEAPVDCKSDQYPNRIRVGGVSVKEDNGLHGRLLSQEMELLNDNVNTSIQCTDVWVNSGLGSRYPFEPGPSAVEAINGIGTAPMPAWSSSFATPLMLAHTISMRESLYSDEPFDSDLINKILAKFDKQVILDPVQSGQLETFRLGYREQ